jgi:hypothetical protein
MRWAATSTCRFYLVLPNRAGNDFVVHLIALAHVQDTLLAQIDRTALIMAWTVSTASASARCSLSRRR